MEHFTSLLDTVASPSFIHIEVIPPKLHKNVKYLTQDLKISDACGKSLEIAGTFSVALYLGSKRTFVNFHVGEK